MLENINSPQDVKELDIKDLKELAIDIRRFLVKNISKTGGHLGSNLGVVELTIALHYMFNTPKDKIIWDVGHQSYVHKILTGRKNEFNKLRTYKGLSGFPKTNESPHDVFNTGHSSTSISAAVGFAQARQLNKENYSVISIIGDGSMTGGMAYEALNNASHLKSNFITILNDNSMSISKNVGGMSKYLAKIRTEPLYNELKVDVEKALSKIPKVGNSLVGTLKRSKESIKQLFLQGMIFEELGFTYLGPVDGHNIKELLDILEKAKHIKGPVLVHVKTKKGKGYQPAFSNPSKFHGVQPFDPKTGEVKKGDKIAKDSYSKVFGNTMIELAKENEKIVAISAAMPDGTGLKKFSKIYPDRFFDVGIAEQHAVTFAAGMAASDYVPVVAIYSSFLQRAYDQIIHDVCIQELPVVFAIDRAGLVGSDGETHQGIFDYSFLRHIPNLTVMAPKNKYELVEQLKFATSLGKPVAIRYPRGDAFDELEEFATPIKLGKSEVLVRDGNIALVALGTMVPIAYEVHRILKEKGIDSTVINARFVAPIDGSLMKSLEKDHKYIFTLEENILDGGFGQAITQMLKDGEKNDIIIKNIALPNAYIEQGAVDILKKENGLDIDSITSQIERIVSKN